MKYLYPLLIVLLLSCHGKGPRNAGSGLGDKNIQAWEGHINGKIPVMLWFAVNRADSTLCGQLVYTNTVQRQPIMLVGHFDSSITLSEYLKDGSITGVWEGKITDGKLAGKWIAMKSDKELPFELRAKDTTISSADADFTHPEHIDGVYRYGYPSEAGGEINIQRMGADKVIFNASCVTSAPAYNIAQMNDDTLTLNGNKARYSQADENGNCSFTIYFYKTFLTIGYDCDTCNQCGFGLNAEVSGTFIKTADKPKMGMNDQ